MKVLGCPGHMGSQSGTELEVQFLILHKVSRIDRDLVLLILVVLMGLGRGGLVKKKLEIEMPKSGCLRAGEKASPESSSRSGLQKIMEVIEEDFASFMEEERVE